MTFSNYATKENFVNIIKSFLEKNNLEYIENFDLSQISTIKLGAKAKLTIFPKNSLELKKLLKFFYNKKIFYRIFGNLSNVLFVQNIDFPLIITSKMENEVSIDKNLVTVSAGVVISKFCEILRKNSLSGLEALSGIPATIGGAIYSNAGAFGYSISDRLISILVFYDGKFIKLCKNDVKFGHHYSSLSGLIVLEATFLFENKKDYDIMELFNEFTYRRNKTQPTGFSLGSVYKKVNGNSAGFYIERCGLKGLKSGGIVVSNKHANFFINNGNGSISDFLGLCSKVESCVLYQFGVTLYTEIEKVGNKNEIDSRLSHSLKI